MKLLRRLRRSPQWRWYRSRLGLPALVAAVIGALAAAGAFVSEDAWYERVQPEVDGLTRLARPPPDGLLPTPPSPQARESHASVLADSTGRELVAERLLRYAGAEDARLAVERFVREHHGRAAVETNRFYRVVAGCPERCRTVSLGTNDDIAVFLLPLAAGADRARVDAEREHAGLASNELYGWDDVLGPADLLVVVPIVCIFFLPFAARHLWVARHAQQTPYERPPSRELPPGVVDVSSSADEARRRANMVYVGSLAIFALTAIVAAVLPFDAALAVAVLAVPLCWLLTRRVYAGRRQLLTRPGRSALDSAGLLRSVRVRLEIVAAHFAAWFVTVLAWLIGGLPILLAAGTSRAVAEASGAARFAALGVIVLLGLVNIGPIFSRLARRLRVAAADREQEHRRRHSILYLRSFTDDHRLIAAGGPQARAANEVLAFRARIPYEEVIARELNRFGAIVAVAEPGRPRLVPPLGAPRRRLSDRSWQAGVSTRMDEAALIAIAVGSSEGLVWELKEATRAGHLDRVLLVVPPDEDEAIRERWKASREAIADSGGPFVLAPVDAAAILVAELDRTGVRRAIVADRRDEHAYVAAIDHALTDATGGFERRPIDRADDLDLRAASAEAPLGSPREVGVAIVLFMLTGGLYGLYWMFKTHEELKAYTGRGLGGELGLVLWLLGYGAGGLALTAEIATMYEAAGEAPPITRMTGLLFFPGGFLIVPAMVGFVKVQRALNHYWVSRGAGWPPPRPPVHPVLFKLADAPVLRNRRRLHALLSRYRTDR